MLSGVGMTLTSTPRRQVEKTRARELKYVWGINVSDHLHGAMWHDARPGR